MAAAEQADQELLDYGVLADDDLGQLLSNAVDRGGKLFNDLSIGSRLEARGWRLEGSQSIESSGLEQQETSASDLSTKEESSSGLQPLVSAYLW
jgi:hypothetical protein